MSPPGASRPAARAITVAITAAVEAAHLGQLAAFTEASTRLGALDMERVGIVQSAAIRSLLESLHPDGLDADDIRAVLVRVTHSASWFPAFDVDALLTVFTGALGMSDPDDATARFSREALSQHASLVIADLVIADLVVADLVVADLVVADLVAAGQPATDRPSVAHRAAHLAAHLAVLLAVHLEIAVAEIQRAETMELP